MYSINEKLLSRGVESLSDEELVALLVAEGGDEEALELSRGLLAAYSGSLQALVGDDVKRLRMLSGLGLRRASRIKVAAEIGRRVSLAKADEVDVITSDGDVVRIMEPQLSSLRHEECWAIYLASSGRVLERVRISQGGVQATVVDYRLVVKRALELLAVQIVLVHNHPSGSAQPSRQDEELTQRIDAAAKLFDIRLLDHVIIARGAHYSFRGHGKLG